jgi:NitT/TauT family transport system substrate-binding protein
MFFKIIIKAQDSPWTRFVRCLPLEKLCCNLRKRADVMLSPSAELRINTAKHLALSRCYEDEILRLRLRLTLRHSLRRGKVRIGVHEFLSRCHPHLSPPPPRGKMEIGIPRNCDVIVTFLIVLWLTIATIKCDAQDKKLDSFTISFASVSGTRAPLWIAKDLGLFEKYGLDGNLVYIASGVTSVNALLGGSVDIIAASGSSAVGAAARGAPLVIIASLGHIAYKLIAHPSITSVQGLKGKIIGSSRIGAGTDFALQRLLPKLGLTPGKDVTLLPTGISESDRRLLMLVQGKIDATLGTEDNLLQLAARGMKFSVLADLYEAGVYTTGSDIATNRQLFKQKPRQLKAFLMAISEGIYIGRTHKEQAYRVYRKYLKVEDPKMLESMHKNYLLGSIPARPFPKEEAIQNDIEDLSHSYAHLKGRKAAEFVDISLLKSLEDEGFFKKFYGK